MPAAWACSSTGANASLAASVTIASFLLAMACWIWLTITVGSSAWPVGPLSVSSTSRAVAAFSMQSPTSRHVG